MQSNAMAEKSQDVKKKKFLVSRNIMEETLQPAA